MSMSLGWLPVTKKEPKYLDDQLKFIFRKNFVLPKVLDHSNVEFLKGLDAAGVKGAAALISAIDKYQEVEVFEA